MQKYLILIMVCLAGISQSREYPRGAIVAIYIKGISPEYKPIQEFKSWLVERMTTFSAEKKDFKLFNPAVYDSGEVPAGISHMFIITIDSVNLVPMKKYQEDVKTANAAMDKIGNSPVPYLFNERQTGILRTIISKIAYGAVDHPEMSVFLEIRDLKKKSNTWDYRDELDIESTAAMSEEEQLAQLLAALKNLIMEEAGFLTLD